MKVEDFRKAKKLLDEIERLERLQAHLEKGVPHLRIGEQSIADAADQELHDAIKEAAMGLVKKRIIWASEQLGHL